MVANCGQNVLQPAPVGQSVVNIVCGDTPNAQFTAQGRKLLTQKRMHRKVVMLQLEVKIIVSE